MTLRHCYLPLVQLNRLRVLLQPVADIKGFRWSRLWNTRNPHAGHPLLAVWSPRCFGHSRLHAFGVHHAINTR
jgi:hypothetical protein